MTDYQLLVCFGIICIILSYLLGYIVGFKRGFDGDPLFKHIEQNTSLKPEVFNGTAKPSEEDK